MSQSLPSFAFVDIKTTGGPAHTARIMEIAILRLTAEGVHEWHSLVNPERPVASSAQAQTGIVPAMLTHAPLFEELAGSIADQLAGHLFVAHNARADYAALQQAYARMNADFQAPMLCTARLSRRLFAREKQHSLDAIIARHGLIPGRDAAARHRALGDARLVLQFWQRLRRIFPMTELESLVRKLAGLPQHPVATDTPAAASPPARPTRYLHNLPWRDAGKPLQFFLREAGAHRHGASPQARLRLPVTSLYSWRLHRDLVSGSLELTDNDPGLGMDDQLYGLFKSRDGARQWLQDLVRNHALCAVHVGLQKTGAGQPCDAYPAGHCQGACISQEPAAAHFNRMMRALEPHRVQVWPYEGPLLVPEGDTLHVLYRWCHIDAIAHVRQVPEALARYGPTEFNHELYQALRPSLPAVRIDLPASYDI